MTAVRDTRAATWTGLWVASCAATAAMVSLAAAITTPPRSGPYCQRDCVAYPYTDAAAFVPRDYLWMYPALVTALLFVVLTAYLRDRVPPGRRLFTRSAWGFGVIGSGTLVADYGIQLTVMQPGLLRGETEGLSPLSQYNPHGLFIGLEDIGYATVNLALLLLGVALVGDGSKLVRAAGWVFSTGGTLTIVALILYGAVYRANLAYRFEVVSLLVTWLVLIAGGFLLSVALARGLRKGASGGQPAG